MPILSKLGDMIAGASPDDVKKASAQRTQGMKNPDVMAKAQGIKKKNIMQKLIQRLSGGGRSW